MELNSGKNMKTLITFDNFNCFDFGDEVKESIDTLNQFVEYLRHDLEDDGFTIIKSDTFQFMRDKWKNIRYNDSSWKSRRDEFNLYKGKEIEVFEIGGFHSNFNLYDVTSHVRRLLDESKILGYNNFEIRKITQMSRKSQDVTSQFINKRPLLSTAKKEVIQLQILIMK
jgi:hypothetical protein